MQGPHQVAQKSTKYNLLSVFVAILDAFICSATLICAEKNNGTNMVAIVNKILFLI
jgi:hypothetical protein